MLKSALLHCALAWVIAVGPGSVLSIASPAPSLSGLTISPNYVFGGGTTQGIVTISAPAPPGGVTVSLSSSSGVLFFPATTYSGRGRFVRAVPDHMRPGESELRQVDCGQLQRRESDSLFVSVPGT